VTVKFIDVVGSTALSTQLDPEELRAVIQKYRETCATVRRRFEGYLAKYIGDGLLVYFGYPQAHEDDAQRAVRAGLEVVRAIHELPLPRNIRLQQPLQVRIGIHTGLVVAGEIGGGDTREPLAIVGETPNIAARLQEIAAPNTVAISAATYRLVQGYFACQDLGPQMLKGISTPLTVYRVVGESGVESRFEVAVRTGLTPLVGRDEELGLLLKHWEQVKAGRGQVALLNGEPGIGKSRLVQELKERVAKEGYTRIEFRCSPYYQNTAFYPVIEHIQRLLQFHRDDSPQEKVEKLERTLKAYHLPLQEMVPLFAALLSLPQPEHYPPLNLSPQKQKQKTQKAVVAWLAAEAERNPVLAVWEDLQWADPSTLELHSLLLDQAPTARIFTLMTFRPEFSPPWGTRSYITPLTLSRLGRKEIEVMVEKVTGDRALPVEIVQQIVAKTDGVPLFVEELTKMVVEAMRGQVTGDRLQGQEKVGATHASPLLAIPATLQDSLMARLDRLGPAKEVAQLGATLGREFNYELLKAVAPLDETILQKELARLVEAELLYQRGLPPQAYYFFKHALIQDAAYQSLLRSTRQQYH
jgi:class 3 adenylate cyclase